MAVKYCVFWYPTIFQQDFRFPCTERESFSEDISDKALGKYILTVEIKYGKTNQEGECLIVKSQLNRRTFTVKLEAVGGQVDGFVQYSFDTDIKYVDGTSITPSDYKKFESVLKRNVYFLAKQFYHIHEAKNDRDSNLLGYINKDKDEQQVNLKQDDNEALSEYFKSYCNIFTGYARELSSLNRDIQGNEQMLRFYEAKKRLYVQGKKTTPTELEKQQKDLDEYKNLIDEIEREIEEEKRTLPIWEKIGGGEKRKQEIKRKEDIWEEGRINIDEWQKQIERIRSGKSCRKDKKKQKELDKRIREHTRLIRERLRGINRVCENALIEYTYYKTLFESRHNKTFKPDVSDKPKHQDIAFNIRNAIRYVENIKFVNHNRLHMDSLDKVEKSKDLISQVHHTEKKSGVTARFSVFLAILFGLAQIVASAISLDTDRARTEDWVFLFAGLILVVGSIIYIVNMWGMAREKAENN